MAGLTDTFRRNIDALSRRYPGIAAKLLDADPHPHYHAAPAKTGGLVPVYKDGKETIHLNSAYDPEKEAERMVAAAAGDDLSRSYLLFGLDAGYAVAKLLEGDVELVAVVENDIPYLRFLLDSFDLSDQIGDPRLRLIIDDSPARVSTALLREYLPLLHGDISILPKRPRERIQTTFFSNLRGMVPAVLDHAAIDISTQKKFGLRWMRNMTANAGYASSAAQKNYPVLSRFRGSTIHITAAGPSLEEALADLSKAAAGECIVATDTSLPSLLAAGISPDFIVSVDCQIHSYHHFLSGIPTASYLVLDLSSPPPLYRMGKPVIPVSGGHPFSAYLRQRYYPFLGIDTSGGNVTHAAVSFADKLAGREIVLHGADFSYPEGKMYSKGTYIYPYFMSRETRTSNLESGFARMLLERNDLSLSLSTGETVCYRTSLLDSYKERLIASFEETVTPLTFASDGRFFRGRNPPEFSHPQRAIRNFDERPVHWDLFLREVLGALRSLDIAQLPVYLILEKLGIEEKNLIVSLMPLAALAYDRRKRGWELLEDARRRTLGIIEASLPSGKDNSAIADE